MSLSIYTDKIKRIISEIEGNHSQISEHNRNARIGNVGAAAAYLLTSNSDNKSTRTLGQVGAVAGLMYSATERNKSNSFKQRSANELLRGIPEIFNTQSYSTFVACPSASQKQEFLSCALTLSSYFDDFVLEQIKIIQSKHLLSKQNLDYVLNLVSIDLFHGKNNILSFFNKLDKSIEANFYDDLRSDLRQIDIPQLKKEVNYHKAFIGVSIILLILGISLSSQIILVLAIVLLSVSYISSTFKSFFPQHRKLQSARQKFFKQLRESTKLSTIKYY